jgi:hypothetical protein
MVKFGLEHRYAMALHDDQGAPHVHLVVKAVSEQGVRLNIKKATLREWRQEFAHQLRELGVPANATERAVRGQSRASKTAGIYRAMRRGESTHYRNRAEGVGGLPTTRWLLWHDRALDLTTKRRYHDYLRANGLEMPTIEEERADAAGSREKLASAVTWLRNNRRGEPHKILHGENAAYGFRRNLYGAKPVGIAISLTAAGISSWAVFVAATQLPAPTVVEILVSIPLEVRVGLAVSLASLFAWIFVVTQNWVREAAELYAKALLETCDFVAA